MAPINKIHHLYIITGVAEMLGEDDDWLSDSADEMDQEDGLIWIYGPGDEGVWPSPTTGSRRCSA
jgi:hypothetical protein